ncbi:hypothetical protein Ddye_005188 [Dipteronia dyeriana]|uniref:Uncharacterized protein n=1 Tax=Dipteronia dyeriana TaxID=168575 RepID=A0AAD9XG13_9ROSI|nr:hypothetical protein Ddye_005188 [Dipteronia dyeriana]
MDSSSDEAPKLALFSFPSKGKEAPPPPPPVHTGASVPFQWEEAPGKPRPGCTESKPSSTAARSLELPPRLVLTDQVKVNNNGSSPTTVLEGPYVARSLSYTLSLRKGPGEGWGKGSSSRQSNNKESVLFGSSRWVTTTVKKNDKAVGGTFDFFASADDIGHGSRGGGNTKVKITRVSKRSGSFRSLSSSTSHFWTSIYEGFKQVVPWKRSSRQ